MTEPETAPAVAARRPAWRRRWRWPLRAVAAGALLCVLAVTASQIWIRQASSGYVYAAQDVPAAPVALVLGTQVDPGGIPSGFLTARLAIARDLYAAGKVRAILVSGDNGQPDYNEPDAMRQWLIDQGVPAGKVVADYAGFDTYDSCQRAVHIFGVSKLTVITQSYHIQRAVVLCRHAGIDATGVGDDTARRFEPEWRNSSLREHGAWVKALFDVLSGREPVFLGRHETSIEDALRE